jgi:DNA-binding HxlR family transcriptional regulator
MRSYGDACGIARALDVLGDRWALLVIRDLIFGPKRFTDLRAGLPRVSPDVLTQRLRELEDAGLLRHARLRPPAASQVYELTERGRALEPMLLELGRWGAGAPFPGGDITFGPDAAMLALKTMFDPAAATGRNESYELRFGDVEFHVRVADGSLAIARGQAAEPDATIATDPAALAAMLWHGRDSDEPAIARLRELFPLSTARPAASHPSAAHAG